MVTVPLASTTVSVTLSLALAQVTVLPSNIKLPVVVKIAPDLSEEEMKDIAEVCTRKNVLFLLRIIMR